MADPETTTPAPEGAVPGDGDAELLRLGVWHQAMLHRYEGRSPGAPSDQSHMDAMLTLEGRIAALPATTLAGMIVRLRVMWSWECTEDGRIFAGPSTEADKVERLAWSLLQDAERMAARG